MRKKTKEMAYLAIFTSIIILMTFTPFIGYITVGVFSITTIPIVVIIGAIFLGLKGSLWLSLMFGVFSLIRATMPGAMSDPMFLNPLISILPRLLFGLFTYYIYSVFDKTKINNNMKYVLTFVLSILFHTVIVCVMFALVKPLWFIDTMNAVQGTYPYINTIFMVIIMAFLINGALEAVIGSLVGPVIVRQLVKYKEN